MTTVEKISIFEKRGLFFESLFQDDEGYLCLAAKSVGSEVMQEQFFAWPKFKEQALNWIDRLTPSCNMYYCTSLLEKPVRKKHNALPGRIVWADLDFCKITDLNIIPSITIQTSPGKLQGIWRLTEQVSAVDAENANRRLAYAFRDKGCDVSGWDLTQLLRIPTTFNHNYGRAGLAGPFIDIVEANPETHDIKSFDIYPQVKGYEYADLPFEADKLPDADAEDILDGIKFKIAPRAITLFQDPPETDWSKSLFQLITYCLEAGLDRYETFIVCKAAACNKFARNNQPDSFLWKDICRVHGKQTTKLATFGGDWALANHEKNLLTDDELTEAEQTKTIIDDYISWGEAVSDAAPAYHISGALTILSTLLSGALRIPTSFGTIKPNLWFMICADTTLTRKSTAMDMAMDMLTAIRQDAILATDGSLEGLMAGMSARPNQPSVFFRDEFSGLIDLMNKRDYYAGMMEAFTKLYDGRYQKRILRRETIELIDPILIILAGGIKDRILSLLNSEFISSGFIPRFIFTMAESDITRLRPLGPPTESTAETREELFQRFRKMYEWYSQKTIIEIAGNNLETDKEWKVTLTDEAWQFYAKMESTLMDMSLKTTQPDLVTPMYARLCMSGLKTATLISAAEEHKDKVIVNKAHLVKAFSYVEGWRVFADDVINNIGRSGSEILLSSIIKMAQANPGGISKATLMNSLRLNSKDFNAAIDTLHDRGLIEITKSAGKVVHITSRLKKVSA